jgi:hypothetical protein
LHQNSITTATQIDDRDLTDEVRQEQHESHIMLKLDRLSEKFATELSQRSGDFLETTDIRHPRY